MVNSGKSRYAILLAGGKSSRMHEDKAQLSMAGGTLLQHQFRLLSEIADNVLVSRNDGDSNHIADVFDSFGPLGGLHACISHIMDNFAAEANRDVVVVPVDMPLITPELVGQLMTYGREFGLPCYFRDTNLPIYLPNISKALPKLETLLNNDQRIVNTFLEEISAKSLVCHEPDKIANANTPMQWKLIKRNIPDS